MVTENRDDGPESQLDSDALSAFLRKHEPAKEAGNGKSRGARIPRAPATIQDTGLSTLFLLELMLKVFHYVETPTAEHLARVMCLPNRLVNDLLDVLKSDRACEIVGGGTYGVSSA